MQRLVITCTRGARRGARFEFDQERVTIGRRPDNDLCLDPEEDKKASGHHAEITRDEAGYVLTDLGSTNGTYVHGEAVAGSLRLEDGAKVELGRGGPVIQVRLLPRSDVPDPADDTGEAPVSSGRTAVYRQMMLETVRRSSRKLKVMIGVLAVTLVGGAIGVWLLLRHSDAAHKRELEETQARVDREARRRLEDKRDAARSRKDLERRVKRTSDALAKTSKALTDSRTALATTDGALQALRVQIRKTDGEAKKKLEDQARELEHTKAAHQKALDALARKSGAAEFIAKEYRYGLFMLIGQQGGEQFGFCTAFAVNRSGLLATNAHCVVRGIQPIDQAAGTVLARMNQKPERTYRVQRWRVHPRYANTARSPDVALLWLDLGGDTLPMAMPLASPERVRALVPGQAIYTMGFPGRVMNEARPAADFRETVISRVTGFDNSPDSPERNQLVWHAALTSKGTSGSPIFDAEGQVVAVNNGGLSARPVYTPDPATGKLKRSWAYDAHGLNFGIRVDALADMLK